MWDGVLMNDGMFYGSPVTSPLIPSISIGSFHVGPPNHGCCQVWLYKHFRTKRLFALSSHTTGCCPMQLQCTA